MSNLIHKITDKLHGGSDKTDETVTRADATRATSNHGTTGTHGATDAHGLGNTTGTRGATDARELSSTTGTHGTTHALESSSTTGTTGVSSSHGHHGTTMEEAPVVKERVHEHTDHVDKTKREEVHDKTNVIQTVQPIIDEQRDATRTRTEHHGTEVHEHGKAGIDDRTARELQERREKIQAEQGTTVDHSESQRSERPDVHRTEQVNTVEQVVPVVERDIYKPEVVEHKKKEVHIHHDGATLEGTRIAPPVSVQDWKNNNPECHHNDRVV